MTTHVPRKLYGRNLKRGTFSASFPLRARKMRWLCVWWCFIVYFFYTFFFCMLEVSYRFMLFFPHSFNIHFVIHFHTFVFLSFTLTWNSWVFGVAWLASHRHIIISPFVYFISYLSILMFIFFHIVLEFMKIEVACFPSHSNKTLLVYLVSCLYVHVFTSAVVTLWL